MSKEDATKEGKEFSSNNIQLLEKGQDKKDTVTKVSNISQSYIIKKCGGIFTKIKQGLSFATLRKRISSVIHEYIPGAINDWFRQQRIALGVDKKMLISSIEYMVKEDASSFVSGSQKNKTITIHKKDVPLLLIEFSGDDIEEVLTHVCNTYDSKQQREILGSLYEISERPLYEIYHCSHKEIFIAIYLLRGDEEKMRTFFRVMPYSMVQRVLELPSQGLLWEILMYLDARQLVYAASSMTIKTLYKLFISHPNYLSYEQKANIVGALSEYHLKKVFVDIMGHEESSLEECCEAMVEVFSFMKPEQIAWIALLIQRKHKRILLGQYWERPLGVTMSIANGKMSLYQIGFGITHPQLIIDILNSAEWMNPLQKLVVREVLQLLQYHMQYLNRQSRKRWKYVLHEEDHIIIECCREIKKFENQKCHTFFAEISSISRIVDV
jgi:hypothetical protein